MSRMYIKQICAFLIVLPILLLTACSGAKQAHKDERISKTDIKMDTVVSITLYEWEDSSTIDGAMGEIDRLEAILSVDKENSELERLAQNAGIAWTPISPETYEVLKAAKEYSNLSGGSFDVTVGPLVSLWNIHSGKGYYPMDVEREGAMALISNDKLLLKENSAYLEDVGMKVNLGAIAKGYIADKVKELLMKEGVKHAVIDLGRNIVLIGGKLDDGDFHIGVQDPLQAEGTILGILAANNESIVTSGIYERYFEYEGTRYHHILDPFTGYPSGSGLASVTILSGTSIAGDVLSTTCLLSGLEKGMQLIDSLPDTEALFVTADGETYMTDGFKARLK